MGVGVFGGCAIRCREMVDIDFVVARVDVENDVLSEVVALNNPAKPGVVDRLSSTGYFFGRWPGWMHASDYCLVIGRGQDRRERATGCGYHGRL